MKYGYQTIEGKKYYFDKVTGVMLKNAEKVVGTSWSYFGEDGAMVTGWSDHHGNRYYYDENGRMLYGNQIIDGKEWVFDNITGVLQYGFYEKNNKIYYRDKNYEQLFGKQIIDGKTVLLDEVTGELLLGFQKVDGNTYYYIDHEPYIFTGETSKGGKWRYFDEVTGAMAIGWTDHHGHRYYYNENGEMLYGFQEIDGNKYFFDRITGVMATGSKTIDGTTYYFDETSGVMSKAGWRWVDGYKRYFDQNGVMDTDVSRLVTGPYLIKVYKWSNYLIIYAKDEWGNYTVPVKAMICSCGNATPTGTYYSPNKFRWLTMVGGSKAQWCTQILGDYLFHSVPYRIQDPTTLYVGSMYNWLGTTQSLGCIRLQAGDAKWIYDNCSLGTEIFISAYETEGPISKPAFEPLPSWHTWDPTDPTVHYLCTQNGCH